MPTVTGLNKERLLAIEAASITQAEVSGDNLILKNHADETVLTVNVRGPAGPTGLTGPAGDVDSGGYVGTLQDGVDEAKAHTDLSGKGLVAMDLNNSTDPLKTGGDDSYHTVDDVSVTYAFVLGRSYRIDYGMHIEFGSGSTVAQVISLDLREGTNTLARATIPGDTDAHTSGVNGQHVIKTSEWDGNKTLTLRFQKREGSNIRIRNTVSPSYISVTDLGSRFA